MIKARGIRQERAKRKEMTRWVISAKEPDCRGGKSVDKIYSASAYYAVAQTTAYCLLPVTRPRIRQCDAGEPVIPGGRITEVG